jgi:hypothetical protein
MIHNGPYAYNDGRVEVGEAELTDGTTKKVEGAKHDATSRSESFTVGEC